MSLAELKGFLHPQTIVSPLICEQKKDLKMIHDASTLRQPVLGCDVSACELHFFASDTGEIFSCANTLRDVKDVLKRFEGYILAAEATGGYEATLIHNAAERKMTVYRLCGDRVAAHVRASGCHAKTDPMDARAIADYVRLYHTRLMPFILRDKVQIKLAALSSRRDDLVATGTQEKNRLKAPLNKPFARDISKHIDFLEKAIARVEKKIADLIDANQEMRLRKQVLTQMKGIGQTTAAVLIASMPELGQLTNKQAASLAGLAPHPRQSGSKDGYLRTGRGRRRIKSALHMAVLTAVRYDENIKEFYDRLIKNGKKPLVAMTAAARKMIVIANARIRDQISTQQQS